MENCKQTHIVLQGRNICDIYKGTFAWLTKYYFLYKDITHTRNIPFSISCDKNLKISNLATHKSKKKKGFQMDNQKP